MGVRFWIRNLLKWLLRVPEDPTMVYTVIEIKDGQLKKSEAATGDCRRQDYGRGDAKAGQG